MTLPSDAGRALLLAASIASDASDRAVAGDTGGVAGVASETASTLVAPLLAPETLASHDAGFSADVEIIEISVNSEEIRWFDGRPIRPARVLRMRVTAYSPDEQSCGIYADGITASGYSVFTNGGKLVAADTSLLPFGSLVSVPGYDGGEPVPVLDRGGAIKGQRLDVLYPTHNRAMQWGVQHLDVTIWEYADGEPINFQRPRR